MKKILEQLSNLELFLVFLAIHPICSAGLVYSLEANMHIPLFGEMIVGAFNLIGTAACFLLPIYISILVMIIVLKRLF